MATLVSSRIKTAMPLLFYLFTNDGLMLEGFGIILSLELNFFSFVLSGGAMSSVPDVNPPRDNLNVTAKIPSEAPVLVQDGAATPVQGKDILFFSNN